MRGDLPRFAAPDDPRREIAAARPRLLECGFTHRYEQRDSAPVSDAHPPGVTGVHVEPGQGLVRYVVEFGEGNAPAATVFKEAEAISVRFQTR